MMEVGDWGQAIGKERREMRIGSGKGMLYAYACMESG